MPVADALDIVDHAAVLAFAERVHASCESVDVVMNVAGISTWGAVEALEHRHWTRTIDVDLLGPIHVIEAFLPPMVARGRGGHLVNVSSAAGLFGLPWHAPYSAAKFGLRGVSEVLRFDLRRHGIGVSLVCPGAVSSPLVGTVEIVGVDRTHPTMVEARRAFRASRGHTRARRSEDPGRGSPQSVPRVHLARCLAGVPGPALRSAALCPRDAAGERPARACGAPCSPGRQMKRLHGKTVGKVQEDAVPRHILSPTSALSAYAPRAATIPRSGAGRCSTPPKIERWPASRTR